MTADRASGKTWFPLACLAFIVAVAAWSACLAAETEAERIDRLIRQLGSDSFAQREAAGKALEGIGTPALDALRKAAPTALRPRESRAAPSTRSSLPSARASRKAA
jgi:hypothetical protein